MSHASANMFGRLLVFALLMTVGCDRCNREILNPDLVPPDQVDIFTQKQSAQVDILWVIDNSGSMASEQEKIAGRFGQFFTQLLRSSVDYHIGVITTDSDENGVLRSYGGANVPGCASCRFLTNEVGCTNVDVDVTGLDDAAADALLQAECEAQLVFRRLVKVGTGGSAVEAGFVSASLALGAQTIGPDGFPNGSIPPENEGFLREEAALYVIFVSDEEEGAKDQGSPVRYYQRLFEGLKAAGNENKVSIAAITGYPAENFTAPLGDVCGILDTTFDTVAANDDPRAAGVKEDLRNFRVGCVDQEAQVADEAGYAETGGRYIELACRTGGVVANMCEGDYSTALDALGANAAGLLRKFSISQPTCINSGADCALFVEGGGGDPLLDCAGNGFNDGDTDNEPLCVKATCLGDAAGTEPRLMERCGTDAASAERCWLWEEETKSIRFNGGCVPAPGSNVEIRYPLRNDEQCQCNRIVTGG